MPWYTTADARRDAERQALRKQQAGLLDKPQSSKPLTRQALKRQLELAREQVQEAPAYMKPAK